MITPVKLWQNTVLIKTPLKGSGKIRDMSTVVPCPRIAQMAIEQGPDAKQHDTLPGSLDGRPDACIPNKTLHTAKKTHSHKQFHYIYCLLLKQKQMNKRK